MEEEYRKGRRHSKKDYLKVIPILQSFSQYLLFRNMNVDY